VSELGIYAQAIGELVPGELLEWEPDPRVDAIVDMCVSIQDEVRRHRELLAEILTDIRRDASLPQAEATIARAFG
jgi:hypothetical protein